MSDDIKQQTDAHKYLKSKAWEEIETGRESLWTRVFLIGGPLTTEAAVKFQQKEDKDIEEMFYGNGG